MDVEKLIGEEINSFCAGKKIANDIGLSEKANPEAFEALSRRDENQIVTPQMLVDHLTKFITGILPEYKPSIIVERDAIDPNQFNVAIN